MPDLLDLHPAPADVRRLVIEGLSRSPKQLPAWFLYDAEGSRLFDLICQQPEYSLTATETALLEAQAPAIAAAGWRRCSRPQACCRCSALMSSAT